MSVLRSAIEGGRRPAGGGATEPTPALSIAAVSLAEGNSGATLFLFTVAVDRKGSTRAIALAWTVAGSGTDPADAADFAGPMSGATTIAAGATSATIGVQVAGDVQLEATERFTLTVTPTLLIPLAAATATGTILNDDVAANGVLDFGAASRSGLATLFMEDF